MKWHDSTLFNEEEHKSIIFVRLDLDLVQLSLKVVLIEFLVFATDAELLNIDFVHLLDDPLTSNLLKAVIQEVSGMSGEARLDAHVLDVVD